MTLSQTLSMRYSCSRQLAQRLANNLISFASLTQIFSGFCQAYELYRMEVSSYWSACGRIARTALRWVARVSHACFFFFCYCAASWAVEREREEWTQLAGSKFFRCSMAEEVIYRARVRVYAHIFFLWARSRDATLAIILFCAYFIWWILCDRDIMHAL